eukprot:1184322-Prorocentrum_minimum.AAC.2
MRCDVRRAEADTLPEPAEWVPELGGGGTWGAAAAAEEAVGGGGEAPGGMRTSRRLSAKKVSRTIRSAKSSRVAHEGPAPRCHRLPERACGGRQDGCLPLGDAVRERVQPSPSAADTL